ncbi:hypothetical protein EB001_02815 [bacterium]|nr:hypothetical protein [bacterium]
MFITNLLNKIFNADQTQNNTVSWSGTNGLKDIQDDIVEEIRARGCVVVPTTVSLNSQGKNNSQSAIVQGVGLYTWFATGTANGSNVIAANDGGFWVLQANGNFYPSVTTDLTAPTAGTGVNVYSKTDGSTVDILKISGPIYLTNITTVPATPTGGIVLYSQAGVLKYKDPAGTVHTL